MRLVYFVIFVCITLVALPVLGGVCPKVDIEGDIDGNCSVGMEDLVIMVGQWLDEPGCAGHADDCADIYPSTPDGVDGRDFAVLSRQWRKILPGVEISEFMATNSYYAAGESS